MEINDLESTNRLLKVMISLLLRMATEEPALNLRQRIEVLHDLGVKPVEIAEILGRTDSYVNKELSGIRASRKK